MINFDNVTQEDMKEHNSNWYYLVGKRIIQFNKSPTRY